MVVLSPILVATTLVGVGVGVGVGDRRPVRAPAFFCVHDPHAKS